MTKKRCSLKEEQPICHKSDRIGYAAALTSFSMLKDVLLFIWVRYGIDAEREQVDISLIMLSDSSVLQFDCSSMLGKRNGWL